jgi:predicted nucleic acid-binding protein
MTICVDSSVVIPYLNNETFPEIALFQNLLVSDYIVFSPFVVAEILSYPYLTQQDYDFTTQIQCLPFTPEMHIRAGLTRAFLLQKEYKPKLPDTFIAQGCIDHNIPLLTRDVGFKVFEKECGLKLYKTS